MSDYHATGLLDHKTSWILVLAHPGHELRAYHMLERVRPSVVVLTDGSGSTPDSRLGDSRAPLALAGPRPAVTFRALIDREAYAADSPGEELRLVLDEEAFTRKLDARSRYVALRAEAAFDRYGGEAFGIEFMRRVVDGDPPPPSWIPYYEEVGEARVREGRYSSVLRYRAHVKPVIDRLLDSVRPVSYATDIRTLYQ